MTTYFVLYRECDRLFVASGRVGFYTYALHAAKMFTSRWSAENWQRKMSDGDTFLVKKIVRQ